MRQGEKKTQKTKQKKGAGYKSVPGLRPPRARTFAHAERQPAQGGFLQFSDGS